MSWHISKSPENATNPSLFDVPLPPRSFEGHCNFTFGYKGTSSTKDTVPFTICERNHAEREKARQTKATLLNS